MADDENPLLSSKVSDSNLTVALHPLILLTVSDLITRSLLRDLKGPIVGAMLGRQTGRDITAEHAFPCSVIEKPSGQWLLDQEWMERRLQQYKDVHKAPVLDLVGWFTLCPSSGPNSELLALQNQITTVYNETAILVAVHPESIADTNAHTTGGKLPLSVYESFIENEGSKEDGSMQVDGEETKHLRFRHLPYSVETGETEMIAINYVAKGAGSAAALAEEEQPPSPGAVERAEKKGKKRADIPDTIVETKAESTETNPLTTEEEDQIAGITTRLNSVRMLQSRLQLMSQFLKSLPPSILSDETNNDSPDPAQLPHLRNIHALASRLSLLTPPTETSAQGADGLLEASQAQSNDVALTSLLSLLSQDVQNMSEMGRKFNAVEGSKSQRNKTKTAFNQGAFGGMEEHDGGGVGGYGMSHMMV